MPCQLHLSSCCHLDQLCCWNKRILQNGMGLSYSCLTLPQGTVWRYILLMSISRDPEVADGA
ncbi:hypothetical protein LEMLEM_LOCUS27680 [Lemmus lemmus]